jgi:hypothetical protein
LALTTYAIPVVRWWQVHPNHGSGGLFLDPMDLGEFLVLPISSMCSVEPMM